VTPTRADSVLIRPYVNNRMSARSLSGANLLIVPARLGAVTTALHRAPLPRAILARIQKQPAAVIRAALAHQLPLQLRRQQVRRGAHDRPQHAVQPIATPAPRKVAVRGHN